MHRLSSGLGATGGGPGCPDISHSRCLARRELPAAVKPAVLTAATNLLLALPSHAEAGKIFGARCGEGDGATRRAEGHARPPLRPREGGGRRQGLVSAPAPRLLTSRCLFPIADFNLTLPIMMGEFLLLMVFLDKAWFGPVGAVLDARDKELRGKLALVKDNGSEVGAAALVGCCRGDSCC